MEIQIEQNNSYAQPVISTTQSATSNWRYHLFPILLLFILNIIIYANSVNGAWVFDDDPNIVENSNVHMNNLDLESIERAASGMGRKRLDRPLAYLSFGFNYFLGGLNTTGYHIVNISIHLITTVFLYMLILKILNLSKISTRYASRAASIALLTAALWSTHPIHVTSVTYIVQRMASMMSMFYIMAFYFFIMGRTSNFLKLKFVWYFLFIVSFVMAMATKENAIMLPIAIYIFEILLIKPIDKKNYRYHLLLGSLLIIIVLLISFYFANPLSIISGFQNRNFTLTERLLTQPRVLLFYLSLLVYPMTDRFTLIYDLPVSTSLLSPLTTIPSILFWIVWIAVAIFITKKRPLISFCMLFFLINYLVESSFIPLEMIYEHRNYLPSMTLFLLFSIGLISFYYDFSEKNLLKFLTSIFIIVTITGQGISVFKRNVIFEHPLYLWNDNSEKYPNNSRVHTNLGKQYSKLGLHEKAKDCYYTAIKVDDFHRKDLKSIPYQNLGIYMYENNNFETAMDFFNQSLDYNPKNVESKLGKAATLLALNRLIESKKEVEEAMAISPENLRLKAFNGLLLLKSDDYHGAIQMAEKALTEEKLWPDVYRILGEAHYRLGNYSTAKKYWINFLKAYPNDIEAHLSLIWIAHKTNNEKLLINNTIEIIQLINNNLLSDNFNQMIGRNIKNMNCFSEDFIQTFNISNHALNEEKITNKLKVIKNFNKKH